MGEKGALEDSLVKTAKFLAQNFLNTKCCTDCSRIEKAQMNITIKKKFSINKKRLSKMFK